MPAATTSPPPRIFGGDPSSRPRFPDGDGNHPMITPAGTLDALPQSDLTPCIGREFPTLGVRALLAAPEAQIRDLALTISQRGVVFLRGESDAGNSDQEGKEKSTPEDMKQLMLRITRAAGCPESSGLHVHPLTEEGSELGDQVSVISSAKQKKGGGLTHQLSDVSRYASAGWHSDM